MQAGRHKGHRGAEVCKAPGQASGGRRAARPEAARTRARHAAACLAARARRRTRCGCVSRPTAACPGTPSSAPLCGHQADLMPAAYQAMHCSDGVQAAARPFSKSQACRFSVPCVQCTRTCVTVYGRGGYAPLHDTVPSAFSSSGVACAGGLRHLRPLVPRRLRGRYPGTPAQACMIHRLQLCVRERGGEWRKCSSRL